MTTEEIKKKAIEQVKMRYPYPDDEAYHDFPEYIDGFEDGVKWILMQCPYSKEDVETGEILQR